MWPVLIETYCKCTTHRRIESHSIMYNSLQPHGLSSPWNSLGQNTGVDSLSLLQEIFPTQGLNPGLLNCTQILYQLSHKGSSGISLGGDYVLFGAAFHFRSVQYPTGSENRFIHQVCQEGLTSRFFIQKQKARMPHVPQYSRENL